MRAFFAMLTSGALLAPMSAFAYSGVYTRIGLGYGKFGGSELVLHETGADGDIPSSGDGCCASGGPAFDAENSLKNKYNTHQNQKNNNVRDAPGDSTTGKRKLEQRDGGGGREGGGEGRGRGPNALGLTDHLLVCPPCRQNGEEKQGSR